MAKLHVLQGADVGRSFEVADGATIGRDPACAIALRDPSVSRKHARIERRQNAWFVVDTGSRNGITLGGARVKEAELQDLLELSIGDVALRFRALSTAAASAGAPAGAPGGVSGGAPGDAPVETPPQQPAAASDADEIVLEGDWGSAPSAPPPSTGARLPPRSEPPRAPPAPREATAPLAPRTGAFPNTPASLAATTARRAPKGPVEIASRGVLQFKKVENRPGLFNADLDQMSGLTKLAIGVVALAIAAGVFWFAFAGASFLKGKAHGGSEATDVESGEAR